MDARKDSRGGFTGTSHAVDSKALDYRQRQPAQSKRTADDMASLRAALQERINARLIGEDQAWALEATEAALDLLERVGEMLNEDGKAAGGGRENGQVAATESLSFLVPKELR